MFSRVNRLETRMDTGLGELFVCIKFRERRECADAPPQSGAPSALTLRPLVPRTRMQHARRSPRHAPED